MSTATAAIDPNEMLFSCRRYWVNNQERYLELYGGDICHVGGDLLLVSAFENDYEPTPSSVLGALQRTYDIDLREYELREASPHIKYADLKAVTIAPPWKRIAVVTLKKSLDDPASAGMLASILREVRDTLPHVFVHNWESVVTSLLGRGDQGIRTAELVRLLLASFPEWVKSTGRLTTVRVVAYDRDDVVLLAREFNQQVAHYAFAAQIEDAVLAELSRVRDNVPAPLRIWFAQLEQAAPELHNSRAIGKTARTFAEYLCRELSRKHQLATTTAGYEDNLYTLIGKMMPFYKRDSRGPISYLNFIEYVGNSDVHSMIDQKESVMLIYAVCRLAEFAQAELG
jgi:hypothetical protein